MLFDYLDFGAALDGLSPDDYAKVRDTISAALLRAYEVGRGDGWRDGEAARDRQARRIETFLRVWSSGARYLSH